MSNTYQNVFFSFIDNLLFYDKHSGCIPNHIY